MSTQTLRVLHQHPQPGLAPILRLPFDILYKIFLLTHTEDPGEFRFVASHVCQQWRATALDCAFLWTKVTFDCNPLRWEKEEELVRRSANAGLEISLEYAAFKASSIKTLKKIMKILLPHTSRWKSVAIFAIPPKILRIFIDAIRHTTFPMLQTLEIRRVVMKCRWKDPSLSWSMPALRNLSLDPSPFVHSSTIFNNLHFLCLNPIYAEGVGPHTMLQSWQDMLARSPALHTLETMDHVPHRSEYPNGNTHGILLHTNLRRLEVGQSMLEELFNLVCMPALGTCKAGSRSSGRVTASFRMVSALSRWPLPCRLQSFEVDGQGWAVDNPGDIAPLRGALRALPLLHSLCFNYVDFDNQWWPTDLFTLCPQLISLQLGDCSGLTGRELLRTVQRQSEGDGGAPSIGLIEIHGHPQLVDVDEETGRALRAIVELRLQEETGLGRTCWSCPSQGSGW